MTNDSNEKDAIRIDKWLWAARFFKTRSLAKTAIENGKVKVDGIRVKPSRTLKLGATLEIQQGHTLKTVILQKLEDRRKSAPEAALLYRETPESVEARALAAEQRKSAAISRPRPERKPNKKERRQIISFNNHLDS